MALASNSDSLTPPNSLSFRRLSEAREEESAVWQIPKIVTVEVDCEAEQREFPVLRAAPAAIDPAQNKTAPTPPAVRAPVFPHAFPVTEGLKSAIPIDVGLKYLRLV
jgi:hypothetical protein